MREEKGIFVFFTIDAGPHLVAFTKPELMEDVAAELESLALFKDVIPSSMGRGAHLVA